MLYPIVYSYIQIMDAFTLSSPSAEMIKLMIIKVVQDYSLLVPKYVNIDAMTEDVCELLRSKSDWVMKQLNGHGIPAKETIMQWISDLFHDEMEVTPEVVAGYLKEEVSEMIEEKWSELDDDWFYPLSNDIYEIVCGIKPQFVDDHIYKFNDFDLAVKRLFEDELSELYISSIELKPSYYELIKQMISDYQAMAGI